MPPTTKPRVLWIDINELFGQFNLVSHPIGISRVMLGLADALIRERGDSFAEVRLLLWDPVRRRPLWAGPEAFGGTLSAFFPALKRRYENSGWQAQPLRSGLKKGLISSLPRPLRFAMFPRLNGVTLFLGWGSFFVYCLFRFHRSRNPVANYTGVKSHASSYLEGGVALVEAILLFGFAIPLWAARVDKRPADSEALLVQVTGEQFAWNIHYAGPDGKFGRTDITLIDVQSNPLGLDRNDPAAKDDVTTLNQLYLPVNKPIIVRLRSKDVIHSFGVPEFRVKQDAIPGLTIPIWFVPTLTTEQMRTQTGNAEFQYEIACAQLCGLGHARMRGFVTVQTAEEFQKWLDEKIKEQSAPDPFR